MAIKLIQGNFYDKLKTIDTKVDMVLCDMPYGTTRNKWDVPIDLTHMWQLLGSVVDEHTPIVLFSKQPFSTNLVFSNVDGYKYQWFWIKNQAGNFVLAKYQPMSVVENVMVFTLNGKRANYYPIMTEGILRTNGGGDPNNNGKGFGGVPWVKTRSKMRYPKSTLFFNTVARNKSLHQSQKPVDLLKYLIETHSKPNDTVLDFCMGSGSTAIACMQAERNFIGIEIDEDIYSMASSRVKHFLTSGKDEFYINYKQNNN